MNSKTFLIIFLIFEVLTVPSKASSRVFYPLHSLHHRKYSYFSVYYFKITLGLVSYIIGMYMYVYRCNIYMYICVVNIKYYRINFNQHHHHILLDITYPQIISINPQHFHFKMYFHSKGKLQEINPIILITYKN